VFFFPLIPPLPPPQNPFGEVTSFFLNKVQSPPGAIFGIGFSLRLLNLLGVGPLLPPFPFPPPCPFSGWRFLVLSPWGTTGFVFRPFFTLRFPRRMGSFFFPVIKLGNPPSRQNTQWPGPGRLRPCFFLSQCSFLTGPESPFRLSFFCFSPFFLKSHCCCFSIPTKDFAPRSPLFANQLSQNGDRPFSRPPPFLGFFSFNLFFGVLKVPCSLFPLAKPFFQGSSPVCCIVDPKKKLTPFFPPPLLRPVTSPSNQGIRIPGTGRSRVPRREKTPSLGFPFSQPLWVNPFIFFFFS